MRRNALKSALILGIFLAVSSCKKEEKVAQNDNNVEQSNNEAVKYDVLSEEEQQKKTPDMVIEELAAGNERFRTGNVTTRDHSQAIIQAVHGQYPKAYILSCIDSRVPVEDIFDKGIGDLFVGRVAGNVISTDQLGSMEYAVKSGSKLIMVLGHENCGAVKSSIDNVKLGNITELLEKIKPAIAITDKTFSGDKSSKNKKYVHDVTINSIKYAIDEIRKRSPYIKEKEDKGEIKIIGSYYDLDDAKIERINYEVHGKKES